MSPGAGVGGAWAARGRVGGAVSAGGRGLGGAKRLRGGYGGLSGRGLAPLS